MGTPRFGQSISPLEEEDDSYEAKLAALVELGQAPEEPPAEEEEFASPALSRPIGEQPPGKAPVVTRKPQPGPRGYGSGLGDLDLAAAQARGNYHRKLSDTSDALYAMGTGRAVPKARDRDDAGELVQRQQGADREFAHSDRQRKLAKEEAERDPTSAESEEVRALAMVLHSGIDKEMGPQWLRMSAASLNKHLPHLKEMMRAKAAAAAKATGGKDPAATEALRREAQKAHPQRDFTGLDYDGIKAQMGDSSSALGRRATLDAAAVAADREQGRYDRDLGDKKKELVRRATVPSRPFLNPDSPPTEDAGKLVMLKDTASENLDAALANLGGLIERLDPIEKLSGETSDQFKSAIQAVNTQYQVLAGLGVPSGKDAEMTANAIGNPSSFWQSLRGRGGAAVKEMRANGQRMADINARVHGYGPRAAIGADSGGVSMVDPKGRKFRVPADQVEASESRGWKRAP